MELKKIELWNFRAHEHFVIEPGNGVTAIVGGNGAGKSSILDGMAWCLYGVKPPEVKRNGQLIKDGMRITKGVKSGVAVTIFDQGETLLIERLFVSKSSVECTVSRVEEDGSLTELAGPAVTHSEAFLGRRLQLDRNSFLTASFVQQKQVDALITSKDKGKVIEDLTGVTAISEGLSLAREEANAQKRLTEAMTFDADRYKEVSDAYPELSTRFEAARENVVSLGEYCKKVKEEADNLNEKYRSLREKVALQRQAQSKIESSNLRTLEAEHKNLVSMADEIQIDPNAEKDYVEASGKAKELEAEREKIVRDLAVIERKQAEYTEAQNKLKEMPENLSEKQKEAQEKLSTIDQEIIAHRSRIEGLVNESGKLKKAIDTLNSGDDASCPTCLRPFEDEAVVGALEDKLAEVKAQGKQNQEELKKKSEEWSLVKSQVDHVATLISERDNLARVPKVDDSDHSGKVDQLAQIDQVLQGVQKKLEEAKAKKAELKRKEDLVKKASEVREAYENEKKSLEEYYELLKDKIDEDAYTGAEKEYEAAREKLDREKSKFVESKHQAQLLKERLKSLKAELDRLEKDRKGYEDALARQEILASTVAELVAFRRARIDVSVESIATMASDFVSRFTLGRMSQIGLDGNFNITATVAGKKREAGELSGGELSSVSIALRLAIAKALTSENFIVLDEVFVSQDRERADAMLGVIKDSFGGQVIIVSHTNSLGDMADNMVTVGDTKVEA